MKRQFLSAIVAICRWREIQVTSLRMLRVLGWTRNSVLKGKKKTLCLESAEPRGKLDFWPIVSSKTRWHTLSLEVLFFHFFSYPESSFHLEFFLHIHEAKVNGERIVSSVCEFYFFARHRWPQQCTFLWKYAIFQSSYWKILRIPSLDKRKLQITFS